MRRDRGFTVIEILIVLATIAIVAAIAVPGVLGSLDFARLNAAARDVHSELQSARLKAVSANRPMRIRFDCPSAGWFRVVELIGTPAVPDALDGDANRCDPTAYPYPLKDSNILTRPNNDGPPRYLGAGASFMASQTIEFWPDGTAHANTAGTNPWPAIVAPVTLTVRYKSNTKSITVNGVGKVQIQ